MKVLSLGPLGKQRDHMTGDYSVWTVVGSQVNLNCYQMDYETNEQWASIVPLSLERLIGGGGTV